MTSRKSFGLGKSFVLGGIIALGLLLFADRMQWIAPGPVVESWKRTIMGKIHSFTAPSPEEKKPLPAPKAVLAWPDFRKPAQQQPLAPPLAAPQTEPKTETASKTGPLLFESKTASLLLIPENREETGAMRFYRAWLALSMQHCTGVLGALDPRLAARGEWSGNRLTLYQDPDPAGDGGCRVQMILKNGRIISSKEEAYIPPDSKRHRGFTAGCDFWHGVACDFNTKSLGPLKQVPYSPEKVEALHRKYTGSN